jgi:5-methylcytosine-specific restriction endonuclease McrA
MAVPVPKPRPKLLDKRKAAAAKVTAWRDVRGLVMERDGRMCRVCRDTAAFDVHHLLPRSRGGADEKSNLIAVCRRCHTDIHGHVAKLRWANEANRAGTLRVEWVK